MGLSTAGSVEWGCTPMPVWVELQLVWIPLVGLIWVGCKLYERRYPSE
jgi:hypothetical protein